MASPGLRPAIAALALLAPLDGCGDHRVMTRGQNEASASGGLADAGGEPGAAVETSPADAGRELPGTRPVPEDAGSVRADGATAQEADSVDAADAAESERLPDCGEPWYRCPGECDSRLALRGGGRHLVPCVDDCSLEVTVLPSRAAMPRDCGPPVVELVVRTIDDGYRSHSATLSEAGWEQAATLSRELDLQNLEIPRCSDCTAASWAYVTGPGSDQFERQLRYPHGSPPEALREADAFVQALIDQLDACAGPLIVDCQDTTPAEDPDQIVGGAACTLVYTDAATAGSAACTLPVDVEAPCRAAAACLCRTDLLDPGHLDQAACEESWLMPRGAITFSDFCGQGADAATRSLSEAWTGFAMAYGADARASAECDGVLAYY